MRANKLWETSVHDRELRLGVWNKDVSEPGSLGRLAAIASFFLNGFSAESERQIFALGIAELPAQLSRMDALIRPEPQPF